jgi:hypothetical protein
MASRNANDYEAIEQWKAPENMKKECPIIVTGLDNK